jgi:hypothetical protein
MPILITNADASQQSVTGIPISAPVGRLLRFDAAGWADGAESMSLVLPILVEEPGDTASEKVVFEAASGAQLAFTLLYETDGATYWRFVWRLAQGQLRVNGGNIGFNPAGKVCAVALSYQKHPQTAGDSRLRLCTFVEGMPETNYAEAYIGNAPLYDAPSSLNIGCVLTPLPPADANMRGTFVLWVMRAAAMNGELIADGRTLDFAVASLNVRNLIFPTPGITDFCGVPARLPAGLVYAINHSCSGRPWNGYYDCRPGKTASACAVFDPSAHDFSHFWNRCSLATVAGSITHVNPYIRAGVAVLPPPVNTSIQEGVTAPFTNVGPIGEPGEAAQRFVNASKGEFSGQLHVLFTGNSRAVFAGAPAELRLDDGTWTGRTLFSTYFEAGIASLAPLWRGGLVGMSNVPIPSGLQGTAASAAETSNGDPEQLFGADCSIGSPLCRFVTTQAAVPVRTATSRLVNTTYSRTWGGSRQATSVAGEANRFRGNGAPRSVNRGYEYRVLVQPELGMPVNEGLEVGFYILRNPRGSSYAYRKEAASAQSAPDTLNAPSVYVMSDTESGNITSSVIASARTPFFDSDTQIATDGFIDVTHAPNALTPNHIGQWLEITTSTGARKDISCITNVTRLSATASRVSYEGALQNTPIVGSDVAYWLTVPAPRYRRIAVTFAPNEAPGWRGLSIAVRLGAIGSGADLLGLHFRNTSRPGVIAGQIARSGCGFSYQQPRYFHATNATSQPSPFAEMVQLLAPDLLICCTADQGDTISFPDLARFALTAYVERWTRAKPMLECVLYSTGPEFTAENVFNFTEDAKASFHVVYRQAAQDLAVPHLSLYYDTAAGTGCMNAHLTGEITESRTHPSTSTDVQRMVAQLEALTAQPCIADFNRDGGVDGTDIMDFYRAWESGLTSADANHDGGVDGADIDPFFRSWESGGCP